MPLVSLDDGWMQFGSGRRWRMRGPRYLCEVDRAGYVPSYSGAAVVVAHIRRVKEFYSGRLALGALDAFGTGVDILVANAFAESLGMVPGPLTRESLEEILRADPELSPGDRLHRVVLHVSLTAKPLERREPGYQDPVATAGRVSLGCQHMLVSTALSLVRAPPEPSGRISAITELVCRLPTDAIFAGELAAKYFNESYPIHQNQPPLLAATYNAGLPRLDATNEWQLRQYGNHLDRWIAYYNTSRSI